MENERQIVRCHICGHDRLKLNHIVGPCTFCDDPIIELNACESLVERARYTTPAHHQQPVVNNFIQVNVINLNFEPGSRLKLRDRINNYLAERLNGIDVPSFRGSND